MDLAQLGAVHAEIPSTDELMPDITFMREEWLIIKKMLRNNPYVFEIACVVIAVLKGF